MANEVLLHPFIQRMKPLVSVIESNWLRFAGIRALPSVLNVSPVGKAAGHTHIFGSSRS
ncbi:hypothetical protein CULT_1810014 [[Clostridium] ultunense Esp]|nr:hypothetical protein CULT_1810014 [[Clostridium] ultunense Esp]